MIEIKQSLIFRSWLRTLKDRQARTIITARINRLARGLAGDVKPVGKGISELRVHHGAGYRVYFQQRNNTLIILLCGGDKSTQDKDIKIAQNIAAEWRDENEK